MADEIKVGVALLDYMETCAEISADLSQALGQVELAKTALEDAYVGDAKEYMEAFLLAFYHHLEKLIFFYGNLTTYMYGCFDKMEEKDEALAQWVIANCEYKEEE
jgi:hypothetical protein